MKTYITLLILIFCFQTKVLSQCSPPMSETCEDANVFCSLDQLNGYACNNPSTMPTHCAPMCSQGGVGHNTSWWGFVTQGGNVTITLTIGGCTVSQGLQYGIWGDCNCGEEIACKSMPCVPPGSVEVINVNLTPCKTYYLWVDGCSGDICDFTLSTNGGGPTTLNPLGFINDEPSGVIDSICVGACNYKFFIDSSAACQPSYQWTLDGDEVGLNKNELYLDFPDEGDFTICVTAYIGNPKSGDICGQEGPRCALIKVRNIPDKLGVPRVICYEQAHPGGHKWHSQRVFSSGVYRQQFTDNNCCKFDSIANYIVLDQPEPAEVYFISCDNQPYIDMFNRAWVGCKQAFQIPLPKSTTPYECDSSILLTSVQIDYSADMQQKLVNDTLEYSPNIRINHPCNIGESYMFQYHWRDLQDTSGTVLSTDERFRPAQPGDYVVDVIVTCLLGSDTAICVRSFEEGFEELKIFKGPFISTTKAVCPGDTFWIIGSAIFQDKNLKYVWTVEGGDILSNADSSSIQVVWNFQPGEQTFVSLKLRKDSTESQSAVCEIVSIHPDPLPEKLKVFGKIGKLSANSALNGNWSVIAAPFSAVIDDASIPLTYVAVEGFGTYCFEWLASLPNCEERDTVCIEFKDIVTYDDKEERKHERGDSLFGKLIHRERLDRALHVSSIGDDHIVISSKNTLVAKPEVEWFDLAGKLIAYSNNNEVFDGNRLKLVKPDISGVYVIKVTIESEISYFKIVLSEK